MGKLTNRKLQEVKGNFYAVYTFGEDGRRCGCISGCNIVRMAEEAQNGLSLIFTDELENARIPREAIAEFTVKEGRNNTHSVGMWVLEVEAAQRHRATWQQVQGIFDCAKAWLRNNKVEGGAANE